MTLKYRLIKIPLVLIATTLMLGVVGLVWGRSELELWGDREVPLSGPVEVSLSRGMSMRALASELESSKVVTNRWLFMGWAKLFTDYARFQAGRYRFEESISPHLIASAMISGDVYRPVLFELTVPEGFSINKISERLASSDPQLAQEFNEAARSPRLAAELGVPASSLEGYLFPATYRLTYRPTGDQLVREMVKAFFAGVPSNYQSRLAQLGLNLNQGVIIASLIELEASAPDERRMVSEVIHNRLKFKMALGIDAAIIYGIKDFDGDIRASHLKDSSNPYNLRIHGGLPPSAIGSPSLDALNAVVEPTRAGYLYYVADPAAPGRHKFTRSLAEHNREVRKLVASRSNR